MADCAAAFHLPMVSQATKAIYGEDVLAAYPVRDYVQFLLERPTMKKVNDERKIGAVALVEHFKK
jgi:glutathione S-transferase